MDLRSLLLETIKPLHQFHDKASLEWIISNRPSEILKKTRIKSSHAERIKKSKLWEVCDDAWFRNSITRDGIHGFRHSCRVAIHSILLATQNKPDISNEEIESLIYAALLHDCRRKNDNTDSRHGVRAAKWLGMNKDILPQRIIFFKEQVRFSIAVHNNPYNEIINHYKYKKFKFHVDILKTADALDRYRFPREDWWINSKFLKIIPERENMAFAYDLMVESESLFLEQKNNQQAIMGALKKLI